MMQISKLILAKLIFVGLLSVVASSLAFAAPSASAPVNVEEDLQELQQFQQLRELQELDEFGELNEVAQAVAASKAQFPQQPPALAASAPTGSVQQVSPDAAVNVVPVKAIYVTENQPVQILDSKGRLIQVIYLVRKK